MLTQEGKDFILKAALDPTFPEPNIFYLLPYTDNYTPTGDETYAVPGFIEYTDYLEEVRQQWIPTYAAVKTMVNSEVGIITTGASPVTIYGIGITTGGSETKGSTSGNGVLISIGPCAEPFEIDAGKMISLQSLIQLL
jgi:hypothetical protein